MLATMRKANALELPTKITYFRTTTTPMLINSTNEDYSYYLDIIQELIPVDFTILICLLLFIVTIVIYLAYKRMKVTDYRTFIKLEILNEESSVLCDVAKLKYNPEMYCFTVNKQFLSVVKSMCRTVVLWPAGVQVENKFLGLRDAVPSRLSMWFWKGWLMRRIIRGDHYVLLHVMIARVVWLTWY